jgi:hypothetical protein
MSDQPQRAGLLKPWPGMQSDIRVICDEMVFELRKNGTAPIFLKSFRWEDDTIYFEMPDWWNEARRRFSELYQQPEDDVRFQKANMAFSERMFQHFEGTSTLMRDQLEEVLAEFYEQEEIQVAPQLTVVMLPLPFPVGVSAWVDVLGAWVQPQGAGGP